MNISQPKLRSEKFDDDGYVDDDDDDDDDDNSSLQDKFLSRMSTFTCRKILSLLHG